MRTGSYSRRAIISERKEVLQLVLGQPACPKTWLQGGALGAASKLHRGLRWAFLRPLLRGLSWMHKRPVCTEFLQGFHLNYLIKEIYTPPLNEMDESKSSTMAFEIVKSFQ